MYSKKSTNKVKNGAMQPARAYLFDVDGVLTDPEAKRIVLRDIFAELIKRLKRNEPVGFNTGRSLDFIIEQVLDPLEAEVKEAHLLQRIFAIGEKGGVWIFYDESGKRIIQIDKTIQISNKTQDEINKLVLKPYYSDLMFIDKTKQTMVSVELKHRKTVAEFKEPQLRLVEELQEILTRLNLVQKVKVDPTRISTDIENIYVGKALGAKKFVELLQVRGIKPREYLTFGDSVSDYHMYEELKRLCKQAQFIFVGGRGILMKEQEEGVIYTTQLVDRGTLEFLQDEQIE